MGSVPLRAIRRVTGTITQDGGAVETTILTSAKIQTPNPDCTVNLSGELNIIAGTAATEIVIGIYRGTLAGGNRIYTDQGTTVVAGNYYSIPFYVSDQPGDVDGLTYDVTVREISATGNGFPQESSIGGYIS